DFSWLVLLIGLLSLIYGVFEKNIVATIIGAVLSLLTLLFIRYVQQADEPTSKEHSSLLRELEQEEMTVQAVLLKKQRYEDRWV
ncbi:hypothetical protein, partial [Bacillus velezensis]|uniref:hypothetical protein n=1 Tax=Bacillus velezensis TaxID=492670 RepID=UPI0020C0AA6F